jgi:exosortase A
MNAPVMADTPLSAAAPDLRRIGIPLCTGVLLLGLVFNKEVVSAVQTWDASTAYNHCFLVIPIVLYLLWDRRFDLTGIAARPVPAAILLGLPLAAAWLLAERLGIMEGRQLIAIAFIELLFFTVLGPRLWGAMAGPLLYLFFLVPFGEFLTPKLQDVTTWFIRHGLDILNIPAFIDGYIIEIPQGTFFVAEACAGLRFLIASIAFGCLYALLMYRSPVRRGAFILVSAVVPIFANGLRGLGIVWLGYVLGSAQAAAADHIIYGWIFFSAVILTLIALGLPFRQDDMSTRSPRSGADRPVSRRMSPFGIMAISAGIVAVAVAAPLLSAGLALATVRQPEVPVAIDLGPGCQTESAGTDPAAPRVRTQRVACGRFRMDLNWEAFSPRTTAAPVMAERRRLCLRAETEGLQESWLNVPGGPPSAWRIMRSNDPAFITAVSIWMDGKPVRPGLAMRARMALNSLLGSSHTPVVMTVTPVADWASLGAERNSVESTLPAFLNAHPDLTRKVSALSVVR